jgi:hypothetical protein
VEPSDLELYTRSVQQATSTAGGAELDAALTELGWLDAVVEDRPAAVSVLFEQQGLAHTTSAALDELLALTLGVTVRSDQVVVLPPLRHTSPPGSQSGDRIAVRGLGSEANGRRTSAVVVITDGSGVRAVAVPLAQLERRPVVGMDAALGLHEVTGDLAAADLEDLGPVHWSEAVAVGQLALGHELVGASRAMLELARLHALDRVQFGRPIASFQAVRHRLAEALVAVEAAAALLDAAWDEPTPMVAAMAKGLSGRVGRTVARHAQQVLAGIGFTTEHPLHLLVRRVLVLDQLLGAGTALTRQLGTDVLRRQALPATFAL